MPGGGTLRELNQPDSPANIINTTGHKMKKSINPKAMFILAAAAFVAIALQSTEASAQSPWPVGSQWYEVAQAAYNGGQERVTMPFAIEVEAVNFALVVPEYCAPRALASRAQIIPEFGYPGYARWADLKFRSQEIWAGQIRAYYTVDTRYSAAVPLVTALVFSFAQLPNRPGTSCPVRVFANP